jgi:hypothetical protein
VQYLDLIECMETSQKNIPANAEACAHTVRMDWAKLTRCVHGEGEALLRSSFEYSIGEKAPAYCIHSRHAPYAHAWLARRNPACFVAAVGGACESSVGRHGLG